MVPSNLGCSIASMTFAHPVSFLTVLCCTSTLICGQSIVRWNQYIIHLISKLAFAQFTFIFQQINSAKRMHYRLSILLISVFKLVNMGIQLYRQTLGGKHLLKLLHLYLKLTLNMNVFRKINFFKKTAIFNIFKYLLGLKRHLSQLYNKLFEIKYFSLIYQGKEFIFVYII